MIASLGSTSTAIWCTQDHSVSVEYEMAVLEEIRDFAVAGLNAFGHGGLEIGGILYGARQGDGVRLLACAELASEHALGPAFDLSEKDMADLTTLMEPPTGLETIGWFR